MTPMDKSLIRSFSCIILIFSFSISLTFAQKSDLFLQLEALPEVVSVNQLEQHPYFKEAYELLIEQYLDHGNPQAGKFNQRVILSNYNKYSPVIMVTEGYGAVYALKSSSINELSMIVEGNQLVVEHRYFGKSTPDNPNWKYLTIENACADLHRIQKIFKGIYNNQNKWIATGISKGGQNTIAYKAYYPNDMNLWIPYVGPVNFAVEDARMERYIKKTGTARCRQRVENFQLEVLKNRDKIQPLLDSLIDSEGYTYAISNEEVLDYCVLEYSFSFWQWGSDCSEIPSDTTSIRNQFNHLISVSNPNYFAKEKIAPIKAFFVQAEKEFGYYGYDIKPFRSYLKIKTAENYIKDVFLPDEPNFKFNKKTSKFITKSIRKEGRHLLLIYGEYDPWTAAAIIPSQGSNAVCFIKPKASHKTRINNMSYAQRASIYILLENWLEED
jgi:hypothetical protein